MLFIATTISTSISNWCCGVKMPLTLVCKTTLLETEAYMYNRFTFTRTHSYTLTTPGNKNLLIKFKLDNKKDLYSLETSVQHLESGKRAVKLKTDGLTAIDNDSELVLQLPGLVVMNWITGEFNFKTECANDMEIPYKYKVTCSASNDMDKISKVAELDLNGEVDSILNFGSLGIAKLRLSKDGDTVLNAEMFDILDHNKVLNSLSVAGSINWNKFSFNTRYAFNLPYALQRTGHNLHCREFVPGDLLPDLTLNLNCGLRGMAYKDYKIVLKNRKEIIALPKQYQMSLQIIKSRTSWLLEVISSKTQYLPLLNENGVLRLENEIRLNWNTDGYYNSHGAILTFNMVCSNSE